VKNENKRSGVECEAPRQAVTIAQAGTRLFSVVQKATVDPLCQKQNPKFERRPINRSGGFGG
jgi:hypothetical protein